MLRREEWLIRHPENPIIKPSDCPGVDAIMNCGQTVYGDKTILLVSVFFKSGIIQTRVAESNDGVHFEIADKPFIVPDESAAGKFAWRPIDTRITKIEDTYNILYPGPTGKMTPCCLMGKTKDFKTFEHTTERQTRASD